MRSPSNKDPKYKAAVRISHLRRIYEYLKAWDKDPLTAPALWPSEPQSGTLLRKISRKNKTPLLSPRELFKREREPFLQFAEIIRHKNRPATFKYVFPVGADEKEENVRIGLIKYHRDFLRRWNNRKEPDSERHKIELAIRYRRFTLLSCKKAIRAFKKRHEKIGHFDRTFKDLGEKNRDWQAFRNYICSIRKIGRKTWTEFKRRLKAGDGANLNTLSNDLTDRLIKDYFNLKSIRLLKRGPPKT